MITGDFLLFIIIYKQNKTILTINCNLTPFFFKRFVVWLLIGFVYIIKSQTKTYMKKRLIFLLLCLLVGVAANAQRLTLRSCNYKARTFSYGKVENLPTIRDRMESLIEKGYLCLLEEKDANDKPIVAWIFLNDTETPTDFIRDEDEDPVSFYDGQINLFPIVLKGKNLRAFKKGVGYFLADYLGIEYHIDGTTTIDYDKFSKAVRWNGSICRFFFIL